MRLRRITLREELAGDARGEVHAQVFGLAGIANVRAVHLQRTTGAVRPRAAAHDVNKPKTHLMHIN
jgi:hypothetical protein